MSASPCGLPPDIHLLIMSNIDCPRDLRSWIAANPQAFKQVTDYKSAVLGNYIDCNLLPELLAVVRLRQMHTRNPVKPTTDELVDSVRKSMTGIGPRTPDQLWPEDIRSVLGLLKVIEEVCIILSGLWVHDYENTEQYYFLPWRFLPSSRRSQSEWVTEPDDAENLFYKQRAVLCFEIYVQSLYLGRAPDESSSELELCCSLDTILCTWELEGGLFPVWQCFNKIVKFFYRRYDEYLWLVLRDIVDMETVEQKLSKKSKIVLRDPTRSFGQAVRARDTTYHSAKLSWTRLSVEQTSKDLEAIPNNTISAFERQNELNLGPAFVCYRENKGQRVPIYRLSCDDGGAPKCSREYLFQRDGSGLKMVAPLRTTGQKEGLDSVDEILNVWRLVSGGISPMAQLLRMTDAERQHVLSDGFIRANAVSRSDIKRMLRTRLQRRSFLRSWMIKFYAGYRPFERGF